MHRNGCYPFWRQNERRRAWREYAGRTTGPGAFAPDPVDWEGARRQLSGQPASFAASKAFFVASKLPLANADCTAVMTWAVV